MNFIKTIVIPMVLKLSDAKKMHFMNAYELIEEANFKKLSRYGISFKDKEYDKEMRQIFILNKIDAIFPEPNYNEYDLEYIEKCLLSVQ